MNDKEILELFFQEGPSEEQYPYLFSELLDGGQIPEKMWRDFIERMDNLENKLQMVSFSCKMNKIHQDFVQGFFEYYYFLRRVLLASGKYYAPGRFILYPKHKKSYYEVDVPSDAIKFQVSKIPGKQITFLGNWSDFYYDEFVPLTQVQQERFNTLVEAVSESKSTLNLSSKKGQQVGEDKKIKSPLLVIEILDNSYSITFEGQTLAKNKSGNYEVLCEILEGDEILSTDLKDFGRDMNNNELGTMITQSIHEDFILKADKKYYVNPKIKTKIKGGF